MILKGKECTLLGSVDNKERIYDFGYNGIEVIYDKRDGNKDKTSTTNLEELMEKIIFNKVSVKLLKYTDSLSMESKIDIMTLYIGFFNQYTNKIAIPQDIEYDFSTKEKAKETEEKFLKICDDIFNDIDNSIKNRIDLMNKTSEIKPVASSTYVANENDELSIDILRNKLTDEERELVSIYMSKGMLDEKTALLMIYNERDSVREFINDGYLLEDAIKESFKHTKVKVLEAPKPNTEKGYIDMFSLLIVGEVFIYGLIIAILMFIK